MLMPVPPKRIQTSPSHFLVHPEIIPLREQLDMVVSSGGLHWVGDIVGVYRASESRTKFPN